MEDLSLEEKIRHFYQSNDAVSLLGVIPPFICKQKVSTLVLENSKLGAASPTFCAESNRKICQMQDKENGRRDKWDPLFLWFRPNTCCIRAIGIMMEDNGLRRLSSIGCGSALLEWLLWKLITIEEVVCFEVNEQWWTSGYAPPRFMPHKYVDNQPTPLVPSDHALLCCYFNNEPVFREYLAKYEGKLVILIGSENSSRRTVPSPLALVDSNEWALAGTHIQPSNDLIAFYVRKLKQKS